MLCDRIAILADGRLAALGSSLDLKTQFGVGYTLTIVKEGRHHSSSTSGLASARSVRGSSPGQSRASSSVALSEASEHETEVGPCFYTRQCRILKRGAALERHEPGAAWRCKKRQSTTHR